MRTLLLPAIPIRSSAFRTCVFIAALIMAALAAPAVSGQVTLSADGPGSTYELINSKLGGTAEEEPDCSHPAFGRHITEDWDDTLGEYVFIFHIHVTPDNDRCTNFDRQRNEIKAEGPSPAAVKGFYGDICNYRWRFKLDSGFQPSANFTHIHQIKAGDGSDSGSPLITITPRSGSPEKIEIIYTAPSGLSGSGTKTTANLSGFKGQWVEAYERVLYATNGTYQLSLTRVSDGVVLLAYTNNNLNLWRGDATFNRPKWGIYRSLNSSNSLRDEQVRFADFCIGKGSAICPSTILPPFQFVVGVTPASQIVLPGNSTTYTVNVTPLNGTTGVVSLAVSGLPAGVGASFSPASITNTGSSTLTVTASNSAAFGNYALTITALDSRSGTSQSFPVVLSIGDFLVSATPAWQSVVHGSNAVYTVTVTTNSAFTGSITLTASNLPPGASGVFNPSTLSSSGSSTLTVTTSGGDPGGTYSLAVVGTGGTVLRSTGAGVALNVTGDIAAPGALIWIGTNNWSVSANWTNATVGGGGAPGPGNSVLFTNSGTASAPGLVNNIVDSSFAIASLQYAQTNRYHTTQIADGRTLTIDTNLTVGTGTDLGANGILLAAMTGNGALTIANTNCIVTIRQGTAANSAGLTNNPPLPPWQQRATLDLSGLNTFDASLNRLLIAADGANSAFNSREVGTLYLAKTNRVSATTATNGVDVADNASNGPGANNDPALLASYLYLGQTNAFFIDSIGIGRSKSAGILAFNAALTNGANPVAFFRGLTTDRMVTWSVGDASSVGSSNQRTAGTADFSGGMLDARVDTVYIGRSMNGNNTGTGVSAAGTLTFSAGQVDGNRVEIGYQTSATGTGPGASGIINVNGTALLNVNQTLELAHGTTASPAVSGILNLNGGTVQATNVIGGGGIATVNISSGTLDLQGPNPAAGQIASLSTVNIGAIAATSPALLTNAARLNVSNTIVIAPNGTLAGNTVVTAPGLVVNGTISPGAGGPGGITNNGPISFNAGGHYRMAIIDAGAGPAVGWSFLQVNGALNGSASATNRFTVHLQPGAGSIANFSFDTNYDWPIATATGGFAGFNPAGIAVDAANVENDLAGGYFFIRTNGNSILLSFTNNHPPTATTAVLYRNGDTLNVPIATLAAHWSDAEGDAIVLTALGLSTNGAAISTDGTNIFYTNTNQVVDRFTYSIQDVRTNPPAVYQDDDTVRVGVGTVVVVPSLPSIMGISAAGNGFIINGSIGAPTEPYYILTSTNLLLPFTQWVRLATNLSDAGGNILFTNPANPSTPMQFYLLQVP
jgi:hypothetical protein